MRNFCKFPALFWRVWALFAISGTLFCEISNVTGVGVTYKQDFWGHYAVGNEIASVTIFLIFLLLNIFRKLRDARTQRVDKMKTNRNNILARIGINFWYLICGSFQWQKTRTCTIFSAMWWYGVTLKHRVRYFLWSKRNWQVLITSSIKY